MTVSFLKYKTGSPTKLLKHFRLNSALNTIPAAIGWAFEIEDDLSRSQGHQQTLKRGTSVA